MKSVVDRFMEYITWDTQSKAGEKKIPSTTGQMEFAKFLCSELEEAGATEVTLSKEGYVYATIEGNNPHITKVLGFLAHMDTAPAYSGKNVRARIIENYNGEDIILNEEKDIKMSPDMFKGLKEQIGKDLIVTDGTTLLGADDKAGIAEILTMVDYLTKHKEVPHGKIRLAFTPDEEIGRSSEAFDVDYFGADFAYTVDGGKIGEIDYENFNAANVYITIHGQNIHPGYAKGKMKNALTIGLELQQQLPAFERPELTEDYEGFFHLDSMAGDVEQAVMNYIIRDHDSFKFKQKKELMLQAVNYLNLKYGEHTVDIEMNDVYYNMKEMMGSHMNDINRAKEIMKKLNIVPFSAPVRGGTDGARLSFLGLACPNICTGGENGHGKYEYVPVQDMKQIVEILIQLAQYQFDCTIL